MMEKKYSILIVDDNENNLKVIGKMLHDKNYRIALAKSGEEALNYVKKSNYDLILLDIMMPNLDGYDTCKILKEDKETADIPIIFLSAKNSTEDIVKGFQYGAVDYITKPFQSEEVLIRISNHIQLAKAKDEILDKNVQLQEMNNQLESANSKLQLLNDTKDKFFTIISNELKSPFSSLLSITDNLTKGFHSLSFSNIHDTSKVVNDVAKNLFRLVEDLLIWSSSNIGQIPYRPSICNLEELIANSIYLHESIYKQKNITIINSVPRDINIFADANMINTVLKNVFSNALKFTQNRGEIKIYSQIENTFVKLTIEDNGVGISDEMKENIFKLDFQRSTTGTEGEKGTGLGLIICKDFIEKNGGSISLESELEKGSKFILNIPLAIFDD